MFTVQFSTDNAAFDPDSAVECARILYDIAMKLDHGKRAGPVIDVNGNAVGTWELSEGEATIQEG